MIVLTLPCRLPFLGPVLLTDYIYDWDPWPQKIHEHRFLETSSPSEPKKPTCYQESSISQKAEDLSERIASYSRSEKSIHFPPIVQIFEIGFAVVIVSYPKARARLVKELIMQISLLDFFSLTDSESTCLSTVEKTLISVARHLLGRNFRSGPTVLHMELNNNAGWSGHYKVLVQGCLLLVYYSHVASYPLSHWPTSRTRVC